MMINSISAIYFSPTGTTKKIINSVIKGMEINSVEIVDLTLPKVREADVPLISGDIVLIGVPVYATEIPDILNSFLTGLKGSNKPVVLITVYGNMGEGTALNELYSIAHNSGFNVVGAGSFIGEHSFSTEETPIAKGRPDSEDLNKAEEFGRNVMKKMQSMNTLSGTSLEIPQGKAPLIAKVLPKDSARIFAKTPFVDMSKCSHCGLCVKLCPMGAIDNDTLAINEDQCLRCFCCVKRCPKKARKITYEPKFIVTRVLSIKSRVKKEPEIYL